MLNGEEGAAVAAAHPAHYVVIQSGAKVGEMGGVAEKMKLVARSVRRVEKKVPDPKWRPPASRNVLGVSSVSNGVG